MGFLKKEWDCKNPVEHGMEAHDAYRDEGPKEDGKLWFWVLTVIFCSLSVYFTYYVENTIYGGAVKTNWTGWLGAWIGTSIGLKIAKSTGRDKKADKMSKEQKIAIWSVVALLVLGYLLFSWNRPHMWLSGAQLIILLPLAFGVDWALKKKMSRNTVTAWSFLLMFVCVALVTLTVPKVLGMTSLAEGEELLRSEGYQGVYFRDKAMPHWLGEEMMTEALAKMPVAIENEFVYLYGGAKDGKSYGILVDPYGRGILAEAESLPGTIVYDWLH